MGGAVAKAVDPELARVASARHAAPRRHGDRRVDRPQRPPGPALHQRAEVRQLVGEPTEDEVRLGAVQADHGNAGDQIIPCRVASADRVGAGAAFELGQHARDDALDGPLGVVELLGDASRDLAVGQQPEHGELTGGERAVVRLTGLRRLRRKHPAQQLGWDRSAAARHRPDAGQQPRRRQPAQHQHRGQVRVGRLLVGLGVANAAEQADVDPPGRRGLLRDPGPIHLEDHHRRTRQRRTRGLIGRPLAGAVQEHQRLTARGHASRRTSALDNELGMCCGSPGKWELDPAKSGVACWSHYVWACRPAPPPAQRQRSLAILRLRKSK